MYESLRLFFSVYEIDAVMKALIKHIAFALVDHPQKVFVAEVEGSQTLVLQLKVAREDLGKVIGRKGRTADAIRTILDAASAKRKIHTILEIIDKTHGKPDKAFPDERFRSIGFASLPERSHKVGGQKNSYGRRLGGTVNGVVKWFNDKKGFGFIKQEKGEDVFVHHTALKGSGFKTLAEGDRVTYDVEQGRKGPVPNNVSKI